MVELHPGDLLLRVGFIVTNGSLPSERTFTLRNGRVAAEKRIKERTHALKWRGFPSVRYAANAVRLQLHATACNLANVLRTLATREVVGTWSRTLQREREIKAGARLVRPTRTPCSRSPKRRCRARSSPACPC